MTPTPVNRPPGRRAPSGARPNARYTPLDAPGPLPWEMVRSVPAIRRDTLGFLERLVARYGDLVAFPMPRGAVLLVNDPQAARRVLQDNHRGYSKDTLQYGSLSAVTGSGLLTADGTAWRERRRQVQPAFHHARLDGVAGAAAQAAEGLRRRWLTAPGGVLDVDHAAMEATLQVVGRTLLGEDGSGSPPSARSGAAVVAAVDAALAVVVSRAASPLPAGLPTPSRRRLRRAVATLDQLCLEVVARRRAAGFTDSDQDLLALLLGAAGPGAAGGLDDRQVRDEIVTLVIAGHETVASSLTWTLRLLADHPSVQDRLAAELAGLGERAPAWSDLPRLPWTRAVVAEALRLYPPAWVISRRATAPDVLAGVRVPTGTLVLVSPYLLGRRRASFPRPEAFEPARFLEDPELVRSPAYLPFGAGPRLCIGRDFALLEATVMLAVLVAGTRVLPVPGRPTRTRALVTLRPAGGLPLRLARTPAGPSQP